MVHISADSFELGPYKPIQVTIAEDMYAEANGNIYYEKTPILKYFRNGVILEA